MGRAGPSCGRGAGRRAAFGPTSRGSLPAMRPGRGPHHAAGRSTVGPHPGPDARGCDPRKGWHLTLTELSGPGEIQKPTMSPSRDRALEGRAGPDPPGSPRTSGRMRGETRRTAGTARGRARGCPWVGATPFKRPPSLGGGGEESQEQDFGAPSQRNALSLSARDLARNQSDGGGAGHLGEKEKKNNSNVGTRRKSK